MGIPAVMKQDRGGFCRVHECVSAAAGRQYQRAVACGERLGGLPVNGHNAEVVVLQFDCENRTLRSVDKAEPQALIAES